MIQHGCSCIGSPAGSRTSLSSRTFVRLLPPSLCRWAHLAVSGSRLACGRARAAKSQDGSSPSFDFYLPSRPLPPGAPRGTAGEETRSREVSGLLIRLISLIERFIALLGVPAMFRAAARLASRPAAPHMPEHRAAPPVASLSYRTGYCPSLIRSFRSSLRTVREASAILTDETKQER